MIEESQADFICLQEVVADFMEEIIKNKHIQDNYYISGNDINDYGLLILSKWPVYFYEFKFSNSWMGRSLLVAEVVYRRQKAFSEKNYKYDTFLISTSHLESLDNKLKRGEQMKYIQNKVLKGHDSIFMGDFNFDYKWKDESTHLDRDNYSDLWEELKDPKEEAYTMNGTTLFKPVVLDHILLSKNSAFAPEFITRVGNFCCRNFSHDLIDEIREDDVVRTPSDHLGLYATIKKSYD